MANTSQQQPFFDIHARPAPPPSAAELLARIDAAGDRIPDALVWAWLAALHGEGGEAVP